MGQEKGRGQGQEKKRGQGKGTGAGERERGWGRRKEEEKGKRKGEGRGMRMGEGRGWVKGKGEVKSKRREGEVMGRAGGQVKTGRVRASEGQGVGRESKEKGTYKQVNTCQLSNQIKRMTSEKCCIVLCRTALHYAGGYRTVPVQGPRLYYCYCCSQRLERAFNQIRRLLINRTNKKRFI